MNANLIIKSNTQNANINDMKESNEFDDLLVRPPNVLLTKWSTIQIKSSSKHELYKYHINSINQPFYKQKISAFNLSAMLHWWKNVILILFVLHYYFVIRGVHWYLSRYLCEIGIHIRLEHLTDRVSHILVFSIKSSFTTI